MHLIAIKVRIDILRLAQFGYPKRLAMNVNQRNCGVSKETQQRLRT